jgi:SAM-dependent methyltransferase
MPYVAYSKYYSFYQHFQIAWIRKFVVRVRFIYYTKILNRLRTFQKYDDKSDNTIFHNLMGLVYASGTRVLSLIHPLTAIESLDRRTAKVLCVGPRTEGELFLLLGLGFNKTNIKALDLISYSPWVDLGDMHDMPYRENSFDLIILGWVIAYSHTPELAAKNIIRVSKPGAVIAISVEYSTDEMEQQFIIDAGYKAGNPLRIRKTDDILKHFGQAVDTIYVKYDIPGELISQIGNIIIIFSIKK